MPKAFSFPVFILAGLFFLLAVKMVSRLKAEPVGKELPFGRKIRALAFSPDGKLLAATLGEPKERGRVILWNLADRKLLWSHPEVLGVPALAFSPEGKTLAIGGYDNIAKLLDVHTGRVTKTFPGHEKWARAVAFSPDGKTLASGGWDRMVKLWDVASGKERKTLAATTDKLWAVSFSANGRWLLAAGGNVKIWDVQTGQEKLATPQGTFFIPWALFASDQWFLTGDYGGTIRLRNVATGEQRLRFGGIGGVERLALSLKARTLAACGFSPTIHLFEFTLQEPTPGQQKRLRELLVRLDDDDYLVREAAGKEMLAIGLVAEPTLRRAMKDSSSAEVRIRCRRLRQDLLHKPKAVLTDPSGRVEALAFSPNGRLLASAGEGGMVRLWNVEKRSEKGNLLVPEK